MRQLGLYDQCRARSETSRLGEPAIAQPLCTAVQIMIVDLLKQAGVKMHSVVGHSSGEIAAALHIIVASMPLLLRARMDKKVL